MIEKDFKIMQRLAEAYKIGNEVGSKAIKSAVLTEIQKRGAFLKGRVISYENVKFTV